MSYERIKISKYAPALSRPSELIEWLTFGERCAIEIERKGEGENHLF
tara:strand:+ start:412 stop:552 length:141 start_codon:yes stop_codon:yes gene_type:complete